MVVGKEQFNQAMQEINESYAKLWAKVEALEAKVKELEESKSKVRAKADAA